MKPVRCVALSVVKHAYVARGVAAHPRFELVVVADDADRPEWVHKRNREFADEMHVPYVMNVERALTEYDVQVAVVCSDVERHCDYSIRAAEAGLHIVQDKPMSDRLAECDRLVDAVERHRVKFLMWNRNFLPSLVHARATIDSGAIGQLCAIHVDFYFSKDAGPPKGARQPGSPPINWLEFQQAARVSGADGGLATRPLGELQVEGIYPLAYLQFLTGAQIERVFARTAAHFHQVNVDNQIEDLATVTLEMKSGLVGSLCIGRIGAASHPDIGEIKLHILGTKGALVIQEARPEVAIYYRGQPAQEYRHVRLAEENSFLLMEDFARAIDTNGETILDARAGRAICAVVQAAIESGRTGKAVPVA